jgi:RND superfamily putative drug exporter
LFERLGRAMYHGRWVVIGIWLTVLLVSLPFVPRVSSVLKGGGFANGVSDQATSLLVRDLHFYPSNLTVIFTSPTLTATDPRFRRAMEQALVPARSLPHVARIDTYFNRPPTLQDRRLISDDGHSALAILQYSLSFDLLQGLVPQVRSAIHSPTLQILVAGDSAVFGDIQRLAKG